MSASCPSVVSATVATTTRALCVAAFVWCTLLGGIEAAAVKCVLNPYYKPVCGSDNNTYGNKDLLNCFNRQRSRHRQIQLRSHGECEKLVCPNYDDLQGPWWSYRWTSVCGNDGHSYGHIHQVRCLKEFHPGLEVLHEGPCSLFEVRIALGRNRKRRACADRRRLYEKNPICTQPNNVTYSNPFEALCAQPVGGLREKVGGMCGGTTQRNCEKAHELGRQLRDADPKERTAQLACGSDMRTYRSPYHLECSRRFNVHLYLKYHGRCRKQNPCPEKLKHTLVPTPVCGSNGASYASYESFVCAQRRMAKDLKFLHTGACIQAPPTLVPIG